MRKLIIAFFVLMTLILAGCQTQDEKGDALTEAGKDRLKRFVLRVTSEMLRDGVELKPTSDVNGGFRIQLVGENVEIDLSDKALSDLLLKHLLPRYRAIVSGVE